MPMLWYAYIQVLKSCWCIIFRRVDADFRLLPVPYRTLRFHANCFDARRRFQSSKPSTFFLGPVGTGYMVSTGSLTEYWVQVGHEIGVKEACGRHHTSMKCSRIPQPVAITDGTHQDSCVGLGEDLRRRIVFGCWGVYIGEVDQSCQRQLTRRWLVSHASPIADT
jgi:hypothetical protein